MLKIWRIIKIINQSIVILFKNTIMCPIFFQVISDYNISLKSRKREKFNQIINCHSNKVYQSISNSKKQFNDSFIRSTSDSFDQFNITTTFICLIKILDIIYFQEYFKCHSKNKSFNEVPPLLMSLNNYKNYYLTKIFIII